MPPLHSVLTASDGDVEAWVDALREVLQAEAFAGECAAESIDVLVGATAGVRSALEESKTVRLEDVSALATIICSRGGLNGGTAKFQLLSGQDEAALELVSARHCLEGSSDEGAALVAASEVVGKGGVGLLSSGGASSQVAFVGKDGKSVRALSLPTHIKKGNSMCLEKGAVRGITEYESYLESLVADLKATECFVGKLKGTFVAIEMNAGYAGKVAGINGRPMLAREATIALENALSAWKSDIASREAAQAVGEGSSSDLKPLTWFDMCHGTATAAAIMMVRDLLHPQKSQVVFNRVFDQKKGGALQPSWSLGYYLKTRAEKANTKGHAKEGGSTGKKRLS